MFQASMRWASISATDHAKACSRMRGASSARRSGGGTRLEPRSYVVVAFPLPRRLGGDAGRDRCRWRDRTAPPIRLALKRSLPDRLQTSLVCWQVMAEDVEIAVIRPHLEKHVIRTVPLVQNLFHNEITVL